VRKLAAIALLLAVSPVVTAMGMANQANYNDGKPGSPMQCRTFENDSLGSKCLNPDEHVWAHLKGLFRRTPIDRDENLASTVDASNDDDPRRPRPGPRLLRSSRGGVRQRGVTLVPSLSNARISRVVVWRKKLEVHGALLLHLLSDDREA
jgi:hypothetical protein